MRVNKSRKSTHTIMSEVGFGPITVFRKDGVVAEIPQSQITADGRIKTSIPEGITREKAEALESKGIKLWIAR